MFDDVRVDWRRFKRSIQEGRATRLHVLHKLLHGYGQQALLVYRLERWVRHMRTHPLVWPAAIAATPTVWLMAAYVRRAYGIHLDSSATIGPGLLIGHLGGIHVRQCRIGAQCAIQQRVRLEPAPGGSQGPRIGDRVWIGAHARVSGAFRIGDGATVAPGSVVLCDVEPGWLMAGNPARAVRSGVDNSGIL